MAKKIEPIATEGKPKYERPKRTRAIAASCSGPTLLEILDDIEKPRYKSSDET